MTDPAAFIRANTAPAEAPLVPGITLHLATAITPIWHATEQHLATQGLSPPFWAFAWPGSQALARFLLDHPHHAEGRRVLDFACGCGLAAIAAARCGAATVEAADIDPFATAATRMNAAANGAAVATPEGDIVGTENRWDLILCGDVCYEAPMTRHILPWLHRMAATAEVWLADPGRAYVPTRDMERLAEYDVPTTLELEDRTSRHTVLYRLGARP